MCLEKTTMMNKLLSKWFANELTVTELNPPSNPSPTYTVIGEMRASLAFLFFRIRSFSVSPYGSSIFPVYLATEIL